MDDIFNIDSYPDFCKKLRVSPYRPKTSLRKIEIVALEHCDGYIIPAYDYVFTHWDHDAQSECMDSITAEESNLVVKLICYKHEKKYGKGSIQKIANQELRYARLKMTEEEIKNTDKNPFFKQMWLSIGAFFVSLVLIFLVALIARHLNIGSNTIMFISVCVYAAVSITLSLTVVKIVQVLLFKKAKQYIVQMQQAAEQTSQKEAPGT